MALDNFIAKFSDRYQDVFNKVLVAKAIANFRFESNLKSGESIARIKYDLTNVIVRDVVNHVDRTIDSLSDSEELLNIDQKKGTTFAIASHEKTQAGPLSPVMTIGADVAHKLSQYIDADILGETQNAYADFDAGDLTTTSSTGTPITLSNTTIPQILGQAPAKLRSNNQTLTNLVWVIDSYGISSLTQFILSKDVDLTAATFRNGFVGNVAGAQVFVSENLTGEAVLSLATNVTADDTISIGGVTFTAKAIPSLPGEFDISGTVDGTRAIITNAINGSATGKDSATGYFEVSAANRATLTALRIVATNDDINNIMTVVAKGSGRLVVAETLTDVTDTWSKNFIHSYFGKKGAIDVVVQDKVDVEMRPEPKQRTDNILADALYGYKTFNDGSQQFLDMMISS